MKLRIILCVLVVVCLVSMSMGQSNTSATKQAPVVKQNSQAAAAAKTPEQAKSKAGVGFDTPAKSTTTVQGNTAAKPSMVGVKTSEFHPAPKTSKPLDKGNVPSPTIAPKKQ